LLAGVRLLADNPLLPAHEPGEADVWYTYMGKDSHFTSEADSAGVHRRTFGDHWALRLGLLVVSIAIGSLVIGVYHARRVVPEQLALGAAVQIKPGIVDGVPINAHSPSDYARVYTRGPAAPIASPASIPAATFGGERWLLLGNSQLHSINQLRAGDEIAAYHATRDAGLPVYCLTLPNASLREQVIVTAWAMSVQPPQAVIVPVVFDDLREGDPREELAKLLDEPTRVMLGKSPEGTRVVLELAKLKGAGLKDGQGTERAHESLQQKSEAWLDQRFDSVFPVWRDREQSYARLMADVYQLRNAALRIDSKTKRPIIKARKQENMEALREIIKLARDAGAAVVVYVAPIRWDTEPPYIMIEYAEWKTEVERLCADSGASFVNLERLVPDKLWGTLGGEVDFMHFQGPAHEMVGRKLVEVTRDAINRTPLEAAPKR